MWLGVLRAWWQAPPLRARVLGVLTAASESGGNPWRSGLAIRQRAHFVIGSVYPALARLEREGAIVSRVAPELAIEWRGRLIERRLYALSGSRWPRPALGIMPAWLWSEVHPCPTPVEIAERRRELERAINRYRNAGEPPLPEWLAELDRGRP
jgi:hypothetical protein